MEINKKKHFSTLEIECLISIVEKYKNIVENKITNAITNNEKKEAWALVTEEFNSCPGVNKRSSNQLINLYKNLKRKANKEKANQRVEIFKTGGGIPKKGKESTFILERLLAIGAIARPLPNEFDDDHMYHEVTEITPDNIAYDHNKENWYNEENEAFSCRNTENRCLDSSLETPRASKTQISDFSTNTENRCLDSSLETPRASKTQISDFSTNTENQSLPGRITPKVPQPRKEISGINFTRKRKRPAPSSAIAAEAVCKQADLKAQSIVEENELRRKEHELKQEEHKLKMKCMEEEHKLKMKIMEKQLEILNQISTHPGKFTINFPGFNNVAYEESNMAGTESP